MAEPPNPVIIHRTSFIDHAGTSSRKVGLAAPGTTLHFYARFLLAAHGSPARFRKIHSSVRIAKKRTRVPGWSQRGVSSTRSTGLVRAFRKAGSWAAWKSLKTLPPV